MSAYHSYCRARKIRIRTYTLREIDVDSMIVDKHSLHLEVGLFAVFLVVEFNERVL